MENKDINIQHFQYCKKLEDISLYGFKDIKIKNLLYLDLYTALHERYNIKTFISVISAVLKNHFTCELSSWNNKTVVLSLANMRKDYIKQFNDLKNSLPKYDEILVTNSNIVKFNSLGSMFNRIVCILNWWKKLNFINKNHRLYLILALLYHYDEYEYLNSLYWKNKKNGIVFFDSGHYENIFIQKCKIEGLKTITLQHGQPLFRGEYIDRYNQPMIINLTADISLCRGKYSQGQFIKYGIDKKRLPIIGDIFDNDCVKLNKSLHKIAVFLDTTDRDEGVQCNIDFLTVINEYCNKYNEKVIIKKHPADDYDYSEYIENKNIEKYYEKYSNFELMEREIDIGIVNLSSMYVDLLFHGIIPLKFESNIIFPITENKQNMFKDIDDLYKKISYWRNMRDDKMLLELNNMRDYYRKPITEEQMKNSLELILQK